MKPNTHPETGIAFGVIAGDKIDDDIVEQLLYGKHATNITYEAAREIYLSNKQFDAAQAGEEFNEQRAIDKFVDTYAGEEDNIEGTYQDVKYHSTWFGGALHFYIYESPFVRAFKPCSPCAPGAGDLNEPDPEGVIAYDIPDTWRIG
jgi:hypothetical protein